MKEKLTSITQKTVFIIICLGILAFILSGCATKPQVTAYNYFEFAPQSKANVQSGTQGSQANAIHAAVSAPEGNGDVAVADKDLQKATQASLFGNTAVGDRATDVAASNAMETLKNVRGSSAGQGQTMTKGDASPASGTQTQTPTQTESRTTNIPVSVSKMGAVSQTSATPTATEQAIPAVFSLSIPQARTPVTTAQKSAIDAAIAADTDTAVPAGLDMTLAEWRTLKAAYIECPECLSLTDAERAALQTATGK